LPLRYLFVSQRITMLESMTIFNRGGLVLYQYTANPTIMDKESGGKGGSSYTQQVLQKHCIPVIIDPATPKDKSYLIKEGITFCWKAVTTQNGDAAQDLLVVAVYPDILFEGPRKYLQQWAQGLVQKTSSEYCRFYQATANQKAQESADDDDDDKFLTVPSPQTFDKVFRILLEQSKNQKQQVKDDAQPAPELQQEPSAALSSKTTSTKKNNSKGKEKRQWHDGKAKVTKEAMAGLDMSKKESEVDKLAAQDRALQEARAAYMPTEQDLAQDQDGDDELPDDDATNQGMFADFFAHLTGTKKLTDADLDGPLEQMQEMLTSKNVAAEIAQELCRGVRLKLRNKTLSHGYRVSTAVRQALQSTLDQLLQRNQVDLLQNVVNKRKSDYSIFSSGSKKSQAPYVIAVIGINGVGKSTSLAKLTFYLKENGCSPLLVAGDTFRSGAVEQLSVHAKCLDVPIFSKGYAKDPSAVAKAAIQEATQNGNDVVLIDTAGRMQNNAPLMKALGKMVQENQPDFILLVCEALVGHDGLDQFKMFSKALGHQRKLDGLLLTKFDTVSDKVGAALTLTHETGAPIVFCGTGQKYHHLQKMQASQIIKALFS